VKIIYIHTSAYGGHWVDEEPSFTARTESEI